MQANRFDKHEIRRIAKVLQGNYNTCKLYNLAAWRYEY